MGGTSPVRKLILNMISISLPMGVNKNTRETKATAPIVTIFAFLVINGRSWNRMNRMKQRISIIPTMVLKPKVRAVRRIGNAMFQKV